MTKLIEAVSALSSPWCWKKAVYVAALVVIVAVGGWTKWSVLPTMATHVDDLMVATTILDTRSDIVDTALHRDRVSERSSRMDRLLAWAGNLGVGRDGVQFLLTAVSVSVHSTYAPAQFLLTTLLVRDDSGYQRTLLTARVPSFIAGTLAALFAALVAFRLGGSNARPRAIAAAAIVACSWELLIFSAQMESYAIGVLAVLVLLLLLLQASGTPTRGELLREGSFIALLPWFQYQIVFLLPAYVVARVWQLWRVRHSLVGATVAYSIALIPIVASSALIFRFFLSHYASSGVNWNAGPNGEFLFTLPGGASFGTTLAYLFVFFATNTVSTLSAMTSYLPEQHSAFWAAAVLTLLLAGIGVISFARKPDMQSRSWVVFVAMTVVIWMALVLARKITLSPTRHSLVLLPLVALLAAEGACTVGAWFQQSVAVPLAFAGIVLVTFLLTYPAEVTRRSDPFDEPTMRALVHDAKPDLIVSYHCTRNLRLMNDFGVPQFDWECGSLPRWRGVTPSELPRRILFVSANSPLSVDYFTAARDALGRMMRRPLLSENLDNYSVTVLRRDDGQAPLEVSSKTINGKNSLYVTLLDLRNGSDDTASPASVGLP